MLGLFPLPLLLFSVWFSSFYFAVNFFCYPLLGLVIFCSARILFLSHLLRQSRRTVCLRTSRSEDSNWLAVTVRSRIEGYFPAISQKFLQILASFHDFEEILPIFTIPVLFFDNIRVLAHFLQFVLISQNFPQNSTSFQTFQQITRDFRGFSSFLPFCLFSCVYTLFVIFFMIPPRRWPQYP